MMAIAISTLAEAAAAVVNGRDTNTIEFYIQWLCSRRRRRRGNRSFSFELKLIHPSIHRYTPSLGNMS
jgi:hypothetical protein